MMPCQKSSKEYFIVPCILFLLLTIFFYDIFFLGKTFKVTNANSQALPFGAYGQSDNRPKFIPVNGTDSPVLEEPVFEFIKNNLRRGVLPLWNPHQACGYPLIGMMEVGIFFPLNFILYLFSNVYAWDILILSRFLLGGILTYGLMRTLRFGKIPSFSSAIVFMFTGPMIVLQYWTVNVDILTPLLLICLEHLIQKTRIRNFRHDAKTLSRNNSRSIVFTASVVALTFFAGHPEHVFLVNVFGFLFFCYRTFSLRTKVDWKKACRFLAAAYILGIGLASIILFPFLYNLAFEFWHAHPPGTGLGSGEFSERILSLAVPFFFQKEPLTYDFTFSGWWGGYLGILPLGLSAISLFNRQRRGLNFFFAILAFLIVCKEYGFPFINWIGYLPIFNTCRYAIHTPHLVALSVAILSGMGIRTILLGKNVFKKGMCFSVVMLFWIGINFLYVPNSAKLLIALQASGFALLILILFQIVLWLKDRNRLKTQSVAAVLILLLCFELFAYIHRERSRRFDSFAAAPYMEFLKEKTPRSRAYGIFWAFYPNTATGFGLDDLGIFFSLLPKRFVHFVNTLLLPNNFKNDLRPPALRVLPITEKNFLDLLNVKYLVTPAPDMLKHLLLNFDELESYKNPVYSNEINIYERKSAFERVFIVHRAVFLEDDKSSLALLYQLQNNLDKVIVVSDVVDRQILENLKDVPPTDRSGAKILQYGPNEITLEAQMEHPGFLVLSDAFHPDWQVFVNGEQSKIYRTDYLIRSVFLREGDYRVKFVFKPACFYWGAWVSLIVFLILIILWNVSDRHSDPNRKLPMGHFIPFFFLAFAFSSSCFSGR